MAKVAKEVQSLIPQSYNLAHLEVKREINIRITSVGRLYSCKKNFGIIWTALLILAAYVELYYILN